MAVFNKVIEKCRSALSARIPIIYIVSDSLELIQQVVNSDRLVLRIFNSKAEFRIDGQQPVRNYPKRSISPTNVVTLPLMSSNMKKYLSWDYPTICYYKAEEVKQGELEQYIVDHENKALSKYDILQNSVVILYSSNICVSPMVRMYTEFVTVDYPDAKEIYDQLRTESQRFRLEKPGQSKEATEALNKKLNENCRKYSTELVGFTQEEIRMTLRQIMSRHMQDAWEHPLSNEETVIHLIRERKKSKMQGGILELKDASGATVGGMEQLTQWLNDQKERLTQSDFLRRERGISPPKGVLVCGIPGCGKSEAAKVTAKTFGLPLIQMDVGKLMGKYVGESEQNMHNALAMAEALAPCVLWIDELEKGFSAAGAGNDSGPFKRMFATLLGWMQDNKAPVFIFATANDIGGLPKEFFRSGRFEEKFAVFLPTANECAQIFLSHMHRIQKEIADNTDEYGKKLCVFHEECLDAGKLKRFVNQNFRSGDTARIAIGSDILQIVNTALALPWVRDRYPLSFGDWSEAMKQAIKNCSFYGDGEENLDSIAISYCRLLRKGMKPTTQTPLIRIEDYQPLSLSELMRKDDSPQRPAILESRVPKPKQNQTEGLYDNQVLNLLRERITMVSPILQRSEKEDMITR